MGQMFFPKDNCALVSGAMVLKEDLEGWQTDQHLLDCKNTVQVSMLEQKLTELKNCV
jgi:hypothetical protein